MIFLRRSRHLALVKWSVALFFCSIFVLGKSVSATGQSAPADDKTSPAKNQQCPLDKAQTIYGPLKASYVGGTFAGMPLERKGDFPFYRLGVRQFRVEGQLALEEHEGDFCFEKKPAGRCPADAKASSDGKQCSLSFAYKQIDGLARGARLTQNKGADRTAYITAAGALLTGLLGTSSDSQTKQVIGGVTAFTAVVGYYLLIERSERMENYIAVFVCPGGSQTVPCPVLDDKANFPRGGLYMFRVPNHHDYLSAETGRMVVPETAEAAAK